MSEKIILKRWGIRHNISNFYGTVRETGQKKKGEGKERKERWIRWAKPFKVYLNSPRLKVREANQKREG